MKREYTRETVLDVTLRLFGDEQFAQALAILKEYESELSSIRVLLSILRGSNGKIERLRAYVETAKGDFRDVCLVGYGRKTFRVGMIAPKGISDAELDQAEERAQEEDFAEFEAWVTGRENRLLCETCGGFGVAPLEPSWTTAWEECKVCSGTGYS